MSSVVGRFAPSPSGLLHLGSLVAATASYLNAKQQDGKWLVRIDDLDTPRVVAGSAEAILTTLACFGFVWDDVIYQSQRQAIYQQALSQLDADHHLYACQCTRKQLKERSTQFPFYDRHCRTLNLLDTQSCALRLKTPLSLDENNTWQWIDLIQGTQQSHWQEDVDDFIVRRSDGFFAYHLACAVDDVDFGITEVIRGEDLLPSTAPQQLIQYLLGKPSPQYGHHTLITDPKTGIKLSKATHAQALNVCDASQLLTQALIFLGQNPPQALVDQPVHHIWQWAFSHWRFERIKMGNTGQ